VSRTFTESVVEDAVLVWLESHDYLVKHGPNIAPGDPAAGRADYGRAEIDQQLRDALLPELISDKLRVSRTDSALKAAI
jgi:type I restriction enzyme R subunit